MGLEHLARDAGGLAARRGHVLLRDQVTIHSLGGNTRNRWTQYQLVYSSGIQLFSMAVSVFPPISCALRLATSQNRTKVL